MLSRWVKFCMGVSAVGIALMLGGCSNGGDKANLRVVNTSPDEGEVDVVLDSKTAFTALGYPNSTGYISVDSGSRHLQLEPSGSTTVVVDQNVSVTSGDYYTVLAANYASGIQGVFFTDDNTAATSGDFKIRFINSAPALGPVDVYVVAPNTDISTVSPTVSSLGFESASGYSNITADTYNVYFTAPGTKFAFINTGPITFAAGQIRTIVTLNAQGGGFTSTTLSDLN